MASGDCIPVIDMQDFPAQAEKLIAACENWGCFRIINHGVPPTLMKKTMAVAESLHNRPPETKQRNVNAVIDKGYVAPNKINPLFASLGLYDPASPAAFSAFCDQLDASPQQRETILSYFEATNELAVDIGEKLVESMGLGSELFKGWPCQFRLNRYNFSPQTVGSSGVHAHTDSGFLTILLDDERVCGLEVMNKKSGRFVAVDPMPDTFLINLGDLAKAWSNGRFYNVKHRVICKEETTRFSITLFVLGPREATVEAPPELVDSLHPRLYIPITFEDYRRLRYTTTGAGEVIDLLRIST